VNSREVPRPPRAGWWIAGGIVLLFAAWRVLLLATDPDLQPEADLRKAAAAAAEGRLDDAARHARAALTTRPLDGRPYAQLAVLAQARGDVEEAGRLAEMAVRHAPRDPRARALAAQSAIARSDWTEALRHYDHLLRVNPSLNGQVFPVFTAMAGVEETRAPLAARLATDPPWRSGFLREFARTAPDPRVLFRDPRLKDELSPEEATAYVGRYVADRRWQDAFIAWASLLRVASLTGLTTPMDGGFEPPLIGGPPFSWDIRAPKGVEAALARLPGDAGHALRVQFLGRRAAFNHVRQLTLLPAGNYVLAWRSRLDGLQAQRGLRWTLTCADGAKTRIMATEPEVGTSAWGSRTAGFAVPDDCLAQWLVLELDARIAAETLAAGTAWFDDVRVLPATDG
jgi:tetratricopeptide (TPR) repeat protein